MFSQNRWSPLSDVFRFQREVDRLFNEYRSDPQNEYRSDTRSRAAAGTSPSFQVNATDEGWRVDVPLPGIDPKDVVVEVAGNTLAIRVDAPGDDNGTGGAYEQTLTIPPFLDCEKISAAHRHGMLRLTLPIKDSVKPRRVQIDSPAEDPKTLAGAQ